MGITIPIAIGRRSTVPARSRILIVDEHPLVGGVLCEGLAGLGHDAMHCSDADQALQICRAGRIDAVLCEVGLRTIGGERLTDVLADERPDVAVAILTAWLDHPDARLPLSGRVRRVLLKPIRLDELDRAVTGMLGQPAVLHAN